MKIDTTVNVLNDNKLAIDEAADKVNVSRSDIMKMLLMEAIKNRDHLIEYGKTVTYQKRAPKDMWRNCHIYLSEEENEYLKDIRKYLKNSVSLLLAIAVRNYLKKIIETLLGTKPAQLFDNYLYYGYVPAFGLFFSETYSGKYTINRQH